MKQLLEIMCAVVERRCFNSRQATPIPGLTLYRVDEPTLPAHIMYNPRICIILRGGKTVSLGGSAFEADSNTFLLVTVDLPVTTHIAMAANGDAHVSLILDLDRTLLADVLQRMPLGPVSVNAPAGLVASEMTCGLLEPFMRLLGLLDQPTEIAFVGPLILQEIYFRLLNSGLGNSLAQFAMNGSYLSQISKVTRWIRSHYAEPMTIEALAEIAGMSVTSFHRHFKNVALMTPLQYRTQIRLQEARRMLISGGGGAGTVGLNVGYDSQSQFSRDYKRVFGAPPVRDTARLVRNI